jgi:hypothetical protein
MNVLRPTLLAAALLAAGAAHAADKREARTVAQFSAVMLAAPVRLEVVQGEAEGLVLEGDERSLADIESFVEGGVLKVRVKPSVRYFHGGKITGTLNVRRLERLSIHGSGDLHAARFDAKDFSVSIHGSGNLHIRALTASKLDAGIHGSGDIEVGGRAERFTLDIAGSGDVKAAELESRDVTVNIAGSGDARVWAREQLRVKIAGSGDVRYRGEPKVAPSILGSGTVKRL